MPLPPVFAEFATLNAQNMEEAKSQSFSPWGETPRTVFEVLPRSGWFADDRQGVERSRVERLASSRPMRQRSGTSHVGGGQAPVIAGRRSALHTRSGESWPGSRCRATLWRSRLRTRCTGTVRSRQLVFASGRRMHQTNENTYSNWSIDAQYVAATASLPPWRPACSGEDAWRRLAELFPANIGTWGWTPELF